MLELPRMDGDQAIIVRGQPLLPERFRDSLAKARVLLVQDTGQASPVQGNVPVALLRNRHERRLRVCAQLRGVPDDVPHAEAQLELRARMKRVSVHYQLLVEGKCAERPVLRAPPACPLQ